MASKLPWFKMTPADFMTDDFVLTATAEEIGAYTLWIMTDWINGGIPNDPERLAIIGKIPADLAASMLARLTPKYIKKRDKLCHRKHEEQRRFLELQGKRGKGNRGKPKKTEDLQTNRIETGSRPDENRIESGSNPDRDHKKKNKEEEEENPSPTPPLRSNEPVEQVPRLDEAWEQIQAIYPHPGSMSQASIRWQIELSQQEDPEGFARAVLAAARIAAEIHGRDPNAEKSRSLPNLANFLDGGYREDRSGVLKALKDDGGLTLEDVMEYEKTRAV